MATITTKAIVLSSLKYSDTSLIVKCYTEQEGIKSYIIKGILKAKKGGIKVAYFQPLTQLILVANHSSKSSLNTLKEVQILNPYKTIYRDIVKQSVVLFLSEVLANSIQEEEKNEERRRQGVHVRGGADLVAADLLRRHVQRGAEKQIAARDGEGLALVHAAGDAEIDDLDLAAALLVILDDHDVVGLEVAVDHAQGVSLGQGCSHLTHNGHSVRG